MKTPIELLSPARSLECGKAAILHGADAVYTGAPHFGARAGASNSIADIEKLTRFAHLYRAKVYATINTVLYDNEIDAAVKLIYQLHEAGADAVIIQDMGLLQCDLPPVPLFASTQAHNNTPEKIAFLEKVGFSRVILARELGLSQIAAIRQQTGIELECFVHGALCVSYSGQCYMSQAIAGRSGNRGVCAQPCRSAYRLLDANGRTITENAHILSLMDLNLSEYIAQLIKAGITSFKIEGRMKDSNYVKNITAFYRRRIDGVIENDKNLTKSSSGSIDLHFSPNPYKTFNRGYTAYFIEGRGEKVASPHTPKSTGERLGKVVRATAQWFTIDKRVAISNGDGLCWLHPKNGLEGTLVNRVEENRIFTAKPTDLKAGMEIFRNSDFAFEKTLSGNSSDRRIAVSLDLYEHETGYSLCVEDEDWNRAYYSVEEQKIPAKDAASARQQIDTQLRKLGNTAFSAKKVSIPASFDFFIPGSVLNDMRRQAIQRLQDIRTERYRPRPVRRVTSQAAYPATNLDYRANAANRLAKDFYRKHGVKQIDDAFELQNSYNGKTLMTTKHCIRYHYNMCNKSKKTNEPLYLKDNRHKYRLEFDCSRCEMKIIMEN